MSSLRFTLLMAAGTTLLGGCAGPHDRFGIEQASTKMEILPLTLDDETEITRLVEKKHGHPVLWIESTSDDQATVYVQSATNASHGLSYRYRRIDDGWEEVPGSEASWKSRPYQTTPR